MTIARRVLRSGWTFAVVWALTRAYLGYVWRTTSSYIVGDVRYYYDQVGHAATWSSPLVEYPTPVAWAMNVLRVVTNNDQGAFIWGFAASMVALDATMALLLWHLGGKGRRWALLSWIVFVTFLGPLAYFRFDMAPALLAGGGALLVHRRPGLAGALVACGAALKLWPALLVLPLLGRGAERRRSAVGFLVTGGVLALASLAVGGWSRLVSPLTWQTDRGLQVESIAATPLMYARSFVDGGDWHVALSRYNAYEITGPGVATALRVADVAFALGLLLILVLGLHAARLAQRSALVVAVVMLAVIMVMIVTNKTLSPQYVLWIGGPVAAMLAAAEEDGVPDLSWPLLLASASWLLALGTQEVYPIRYGEIVGSAQSPVAIAVLTARNVGLVLFTVVVCALAWVLTRRVRDRDHPAGETLVPVTETAPDTTD